MKPRVIAMGALAFAIAQCLSGLAAADTPATPGETSSERNELPKVEVRERRSDDTRPKLQHIMKEVDGPLITVTKKTSITKLDSIPTVVDNNLRALFAQTPGLFVSEQQSPGQANLSYRGIGNPQESEFVTVMLDGIPLMSDWIGYPTIYTLPLPQQISEVQLIRGGSSLLYGPEPPPVVNMISRKPVADRALAGYTEAVVGSNGLFGSFNQLSGTSGKLGLPGRRALPHQRWRARQRRFDPARRRPASRLQLGQTMRTPRSTCASRSSKPAIPASSATRNSSPIPVSRRRPTTSSGPTATSSA